MLSNSLNSAFALRVNESELTFGKASEQQVIIVCKVANIVDSPRDKSIAKNSIDQ